jgi:two-component system CheB/CheR fusion protein
MPERRSSPRGSAAPDFQEEVKRVLLERYTPVAVLVDDSFKIVYVHGRLAPFLEAPAIASADNLMKSLKRDIAVAVRAAIVKAKSEDRPVTRRLKMSGPERSTEVGVDVVIVRSRGDRRRRYLILLKEEPGEDGHRKGELAFEAPRRRAPGRVADQGRLRRVNVELDAAKEQLEAANAELLAVNEQLRKGSAVVNAVNDDLTNLLASSQIPILMLDRKLRIRRFTPPAEKAFGVTSADLGRALSGIDLQINAPLLKEAVRDVVAGFEARQLEVRDRQERWYSLWIRPYQTTASAIDGAVLSMTDITEKRNGIRALEAARDYAEAIVETVNDSLLILDQHLKVKSASRFYYELFRTSPGEVNGLSIYELGDGLWNVPSLRKQLTALASDETPFSGWEDEFDVPRVGRRTLTVSGRVVKSDANNEKKIVVAIEDVSLRKQAAEAAALRKSEARQRDFVANVSHELLTPITAIKGYSESLVAGALELPQKRVEFTKIIEKNADRLGNLVEDLLQLSAYDEGRVRRAAQAVNLKSTVDKSLRELMPHARKRGVSFHVSMSDRLRVSINQAELQQVLEKLCENAIKYNRRRGRVTIRARRIGKRVVVSVRDVGMGIPKDDIPRIFDRLHRARNARLKTERGNGLGLSLVRSILSARGCRIWADSAEGKGTTFYFTLPPASRHRESSIA